jgi:hypothetical protein
MNKNIINLNNKWLKNKKVIKNGQINNIIVLMKDRKK